MLFMLNMQTFIEWQRKLKSFQNLAVWDGMLMFLGSDDTVSLVATTRGVRDSLFLLDESCTIFTNSIL